LRLGISDDRGEAHWAPNSLLTLRNTTVGTIQDLQNSWPDKLDLTGFSYRNLGGLSGPDNPDAMINRPAEWFERWLGKQHPYAPAPYQQLASVLREEGRPDTADEVLYAGRERDRCDTCWSRPGWCIWLSTLSAVSGYGIGVYTFRVLMWVFILTGIGAFLLGVFSPNARREAFRGAQARRGGGPVLKIVCGLLWLIGASLQRLLPIPVELNKEFTNFFDDPRENEYWPNLNRPLQLYFVVHAILGWALGIIVLAAMSGIIQKR